MLGPATLKYKTCTKCKRRKSFEAFNKSKRGRHGLNNYCRECDSVNKKKWYLANKVRALAKAERWRTDNPERYLEIQKAHKIKYKEQYSEYYKDWASRNRDKVNLKKHRYYARRRQQLGEVSPDIVDRLLVEQSGRCLYCNRELQEYHLEHMIPVSRGGMHDDINLCLSCPSCNYRKKDKTAEEFQQQIIGGYKNGS